MLGRDKKVREDYRNHTLVAPTAEIKGDISFSGGLHVQGRVEGNISVTGQGGRLVIGENGVVKGEVRVPRVIINGRVEGDVHATEQLELAEKAVIEGNVYYNLIEMVVGAQVNGKLVRQGERKNLPAPDAGKQASAETSRPGASTSAEQPNT